jgi:hypothetical protein
MFEVIFDTFKHSWTKTYYSIDAALAAMDRHPKTRCSVTLMRRGQILQENHWFS